MTDLFTEAELRYLTAHPLGRLATIGPDGAPQAHPVAFTVDEMGLIEIGGPDLRSSQKYRNIGRDPRVSFVVDDQAQPDEMVHPFQSGRGIEIRGYADLAERAGPALFGFSNDVIRIRPARLVAWNLDRPGHHSRDVPA